MAECIAIIEGDRLEGLIAPLVKMMGGKYKPRKIRRAAPTRAEAAVASPPATSVDYSDPGSVARAMARDAKILSYATSSPAIRFQDS